MAGLAVLFCVLAVLGFALVWIANVVARTDIEVKTGMIILFVAGIVGAVVRAALHDSGQLAFTLGGSGAHFLMLVVLLNVLAHIDWAKSAIIASIFTGLLFLFGLAVS